MERFLSIPETITSDPIETRYTRLDALHHSPRSNSVFDETTPIEIQRKVDLDGAQYSLMIAKPLRSCDLEQVLSASSDMPYDSNAAIDYFLHNKNVFGGEQSKYLPLLGKLLKNPDDSGFLDDIVRSFKPHDLAWKDLVNSGSFANLLARDFNTYGSPLFKTAEFVMGEIERNKSLWPPQSGPMNRRMRVERFGKLPAQVRAQMIEKEMNSYQDRKEEERRRIDYVNHIQFEKEHNGESWYFTGNDDIEEFDGKHSIMKDKKEAVIEDTDDGFRIHLRSPFILATVTWKNTRDGRELVIPSSFKKDFIEIPVKGRQGVSAVYHLDPDHIANSIVGMTAMQYILDYPKNAGFAAHKAPELATHRIEEILDHEFIKRSEARFDNAA